MEESILKEAQTKMEKSIESLNINLATVRTGRANPSMLDSIVVNYYNTKTPLKQLAVISVPEGRQLLIKPFDKTCLGEIEKSINEANLGVTPNNDGETIRIIIPEPTEDRRRQLLKQVKSLGEEAKISLRNARHEALNGFKKLELSEDVEKNYGNKVQDLIDEFNKKVEEVVKQKEHDVMQI